jgi:ABC-type dipeptide/oligopeptide/nickel transport system ATPase subunit
MKIEDLSVKAATAKLVALINKSGNVGKTTIGSCMIAPRLPNLALVAYIENTNHIPNQIPAPIGVTSVAV